MSTASVIVAALRAALSAASSPKVAAEKAAYFKNVAQFYGIKTPQLESIHSQHVVNKLQPSDPTVIRQVIIECVHDKYHEIKQCGVLTAFKFKKVLHSGTCSEQLLNDVEALFDNQHVYDWATCDTLCSRVLAECIIASPQLAPRIAAWRGSPLLWKQRAAAVTFVKLAKPAYGFHDTILSTCAVIVQSPERFVQLGCGWVLRELSVHYHASVVAFIKSNYTHFSREGLRYAIEKMNGATRAELLAYKTTVNGNVAADATATTVTSAQAAASSPDGVEMSNSTNGRKRKR